ncbi:hypothetical protein [Variovorax sp. UMC13]|uniref:hypothetical protein n=1 Tax=Variovorax sp. UMC13 TaxID=1862326 RepID=UPI0015FF5989|nr:hypothetical protein [Variovorax sp. UMC13]MBB1599527.1 hypothetical protein [Variovorax sp. UMC13]
MNLYPETITSEAAQAAMEAHSNMALLGAITALCSNSLSHGGRMRAVENRIMAICHKESIAQLKIMDRAQGRTQAPSAALQAEQPK